nr:hypothetical protein [Tanacetum cinerariifolium]
MSNTNTNLQNQTLNALRNAIMEAGGKDRSQHLDLPYKFKWTEKTILVAEGSSRTNTEGYMENYKNLSRDIRNQLDAKSGVVQIILTGIDNDIYSIVDACLNEKEIDKLMALISLSFKKIYKPTNNNLRTSSNTSRANQDNTPRINRKTGYDKRVFNVDGARENVELETHYLHMEKIQEVTPDAVDNSGPIFDTEPLQKDDDDIAKERDLLASLIKKVYDSQNHNKFLESSNKTLIGKLK